MYDYATIKDMARERGIRVKDLCALAPANDPFYTGRPAELKAAHWFAALWQRFGYTTGVYLRRVHYQVVSQDPPVMRPDGAPYGNTQRDWSYLMNASKWSRYLRLVEPGAFVDRRNPEAIIHAHYDGDPSPGYQVSDEWGFDVSLPDFPDLPGFDVDGYTDGNLQPYHVEVWVEKTTMNDVLDPPCRHYGVNLVTGAGELSITAVVDFMRRVREAERPARILYVSDYDPAGLGMPISVARKIEYFQRENGEGDMDIRLQPIVLTAGQVTGYDLPRIPVKDTDLRKAAWERDHGEGQVELDALEALHPGELERITQAAILVYHDSGIRYKAYEQKQALAEALEVTRAEALADLEPEIERLRDEFAETMTQCERTIGGLRERMSELHRDILTRLDGVEVDLDGYPLPDPDFPQESDGMLYSSGRDYLDQLDAYASYRRGGQA